MCLLKPNAEMAASSARRWLLRVDKLLSNEAHRFKVTISKLQRKHIEVCVYQ